MDMGDSDDVDIISDGGPLSVYIAARYSRKVEVAELAMKINQLGAKVCTEWFLEIDDPDTDLDTVDDELLENRAHRDIKEMRCADICISLTEDPKTCWKRGGRHNEFGFCLALGLPLWIVGPRETIYHYLSWVERFSTVDEMLESLKEEIDRA
jgi:hypothetical protein